MKFCVFQSFCFHYEMVGYIIDYFLTNKININYYLNLNYESTEWKIFYEKTFNTTLKWNNFTTFNPENYDYIILLTDDDPVFPNEWIKKYNSKIIIVDHMDKIRRLAITKRIGVKFYYNRPDCEWALPVYQSISKINKKKLLEQNDRIIISCIGERSVPNSDLVLKKLFKNFNQIDFLIMNRIIKNKYSSPNIFTFEKCSTSKMMENLQKSHYVLYFHKSIEFSFNKLTASIPLALNNGCQIIVSDFVNLHYNLKSPIVLKSINETEFEPIILTKNSELDKVYEDLYHEISHRNYVFDNMTKEPEIILPIAGFNIYANILKIIGVQKFDIYFESGNNDFDTVFDTFSEVHHIITSYSNLSKCNIHEANPKFYIYQNNIITESNKIMDRLINKIKKPILFSLNCENKNFINELDLIGKRQQKDLIILKNYSTWLKTLPDLSLVQIQKDSEIKNIIETNYKRYHVIYPFDFYDIIAVLPIL